MDMMTLLCALAGGLTGIGCMGFLCFIAENKRYRRMIEWQVDFVREWWPVILIAGLVLSGIAFSGCRTDATVRGVGSDPQSVTTAQRDAVSKQVVNQLWPIVVMVSVLSIPVSVALAIVLYTGVVRPRRLAKSVSVTEAAK